jgi:hypothetical protein
MEHLFSPCTQLHDILEREGRLGAFNRYHELLQELNLNVSTEELLSAERAFTDADLHAMLGNEDTVAWLTPNAAVVRVGSAGANALAEVLGRNQGPTKLDQCNIDHVVLAHGLRD